MEKVLNFWDSVNYPWLYLILVLVLIVCVIAFIRQCIRIAFLLKRGNITEGVIVFWRDEPVMEGDLASFPNFQFRDHQGNKSIYKHSGHVNKRKNPIGTKRKLIIDPNNPKIIMLYSFWAMVSIPLTLFLIMMILSFLVLPPLI